MTATFSFVILLLIIGAIALFVFILRSVLRINEIVANQKAILKATIQLTEVVKNIRDKANGNFTDFKKM